MAAVAGSKRASTEWPSVGGAILYCPVGATNGHGFPCGYRALATPVRPAVIDPTVRDPDDDHVLACALGAQADLIVTRDRDLLELGAFRDIPILAAREALDRIATAAR